MTGTLRVCATPIGNLGDLTPRVADALATATVVACEDTRRTGRLLAGTAGRATLLSLHDHNEHERADGLVARLVAGEDVCLVSDAGLPAISDPGRTLIAAAIAAGVRVEVLPGPSAVQAALVASGLAADRYAFVGFLPRAPAARERTLDEIDSWRLPIVCFEAPSRLPATLRAIATRAPVRAVAVCRELTKLHEEVVRGSAAELAERWQTPPKGEITVVLGVVEQASLATRDVESAIGELRAAGIGARRASALVAALTGLDRRALYRVAATGPAAAEPAEAD